MRVRLRFVGFGERAAVGVRRVEPEVATALVTGVTAPVVAVLTAALNAWSSRTDARAREAAQARLARLEHDLAKATRQRTLEEHLDAVVARYREPLLRAAFDLQSRLYNAAEQGFLDAYLLRGAEEGRRYVTRSTLSVVGEYLGWVEILRRDLRFLDPAVAERGRALVARLAAVEDRFATDEHPGEAARRMWLFRGEQRAIGELMIDPAPPADTEAGADGIGPCGPPRRPGSPAVPLQGRSSHRRGTVPPRRSDADGRAGRWTERHLRTE